MLEPVDYDDGPHMVWEGRFQPIHRGHLAYVGRLLDFAETLTVVVVANELSSSVAADKLVVPEFSFEVDHHHRAERNPWPLWLRLGAVRVTIAAAYGADRVTILAGHRLDLDWAFWNEVLPPGRIFAVPTRDAFEDAKARAWHALGQKVQRVEVEGLPVVSGTDVRQRVEAGRPLADVVDPVTIDYLTRHGGLPR